MPKYKPEKRSRKSHRKNLDIFYLYGKKGFIRKVLDIDLIHNRGVPFNIGCEAIQAAMYSGLKEIILIGYDFNSFANEKTVYCYNLNESRNMELGFQLFCYSFVNKAHKRLRRYADINNKK